ncbi:MAG: winged helix-turn-helix domain-containing protein [Halobacteriales archaeon]
MEAYGVLDALADSDCRSVLGALRGRSMSANEVSDECDMPLSTTYRKIEVLSDAGLIEERVRISTSGNHASEYVASVRDVRVEVGESGRLEVEVSGR